MSSKQNIFLSHSMSNMSHILWHIACQSEEVQSMFFQTKAAIISTSCQLHARIAIRFFTKAGIKSKLWQLQVHVMQKLRQKLYFIFWESRECIYEEPPAVGTRLFSAHHSVSKLHWSLWVSDSPGSINATCVTRTHSPYPTPVPNQISSYTQPMTWKKITTHAFYWLVLQKLLETYEEQWELYKGYQTPRTWR